MKLVPNQSDPSKWEKFYRAMASGQFKPSRHIQRGLGFKRGKGYTTIQDTVEPKVVAPTEMAIQQAQSEMIHRQEHLSAAPRCRRPAFAKAAGTSQARKRGPSRGPSTHPSKKSKKKTIKALCKGKVVSRGKRRP